MLANSPWQRLRSARQAAERAERLLGRAVVGLDTAQSREGNWVVARVTVRVESAPELRELYALLHGLDGVRMVL
jgi:putative lipoic acid-binding regulatory protein